MSGTIDAGEVEALLRELEDVCDISTATAKNESNQPFSRRKCGSGNVDSLVSRFSSQAERVQFSTYVGTFNEEQHTTAPLWRRLPPLNANAINEVDGALGKGTVLLPQKPLGSALVASPKLISKREGSKVSDSRTLRNDPEGSKQGKEQQRKLSVGSNLEEEEKCREPNFLPIMCARYMNPVGITPRATWGHTLTPMLGHKLLLFGGMDVVHGETAALFEYDTHHVSWDPVFVANNVLPTPRTNHAACSSEGRWLYVSGGTTDRGGRVLGDIYRYDTCTQEWSRLWEYSRGSVTNKNEPTPRLGHSMVFREDRLYIFGGKTIKRDSSMSNGPPVFSTASADVYVFSLTSLKWRRRIHLGKGEGVAVEEGEASTRTGVKNAALKKELVAMSPEKNGGVGRPANRCHHAACILGDKMYINGGASDSGSILSDTWMLDLKEQRWVVVHSGDGADSFPREKHHLFACGEALLVVGGCSPSKHSGRITLKYHNFVAVLPLVGNVTPCWIPVAMGNVAVVAPNKKSFGAAFSGGFVHVFGGVRGSEPASNAMVRFLAADGYFATDSYATATASCGTLRSMMRRVREGDGLITSDVYILPRSWDGSAVIDTPANRPFAAHRALVQHRAPKFWEDVTRCRVVNLRPPGTPGKSTTEFDVNTGTVADGDDTHQSLAVAYYTEGNSRVQGLSLSLSGEQLQCLLDYIYWGDVGCRILSEEAEEEEHVVEGVEKNKEEEREGRSGMRGKSVNGAVDKSNSSLRRGNLQEEVGLVQGLRCAAELYELTPLVDICDALLARSRKKIKQAQERSIKQLQTDLLSLLESSSGSTVTVLFSDPHTKQQVAHALHPMILMASSTFFNDLLRPLVSGERKSFQVGPVAAKLVAGGRGAPRSRRGILVGPVSVPYLAVQPLLRFFYTQHLHVPREVVFATMIGSHLLDVPPLQAYCESILSLEEVNYHTAGQFYSLAGKYQAAFLQETALLTAVLGYAEVRHLPSYKALTEKEAREIDAVAFELGATTWIAPPQPMSEVKPSSVYTSRWNSASPAS